MKVIWTGELLDDDGYGTPARVVIDGDSPFLLENLHTEQKYGGSWDRERQLNTGTLGKALLALAGRKKR